MPPFIETIALSLITNKKEPIGRGVGSVLMVITLTSSSLIPKSLNVNGLEDEPAVSFHNSSSFIISTDTLVILKLKLSIQSINSYTYFNIFFYFTNKSTII